MRVHEAKVDEGRKLLIERVATSRYVSKSARLRDLLLFLGERALEGSGEIHEQEIGHKVFGRPADYDTGSDNIVRVHASMLRKRLEQYFQGEGANEPWIIEIPRGNYLAAFRARTEFDAAAAPVEPEVPKSVRDWRLWAMTGIAAVFAAAAVYLFVDQNRAGIGAVDQRGPTVRTFWSQVFRNQENTDIVVDDAAVGLYQELTGRNLTLSEYFDRSYLKTLPEGAQAAKLDETAVSAIIQHRYSSSSNALFLWKLFQFSGQQAAHAAIVFPRDYSFHALRAGNAILLGNPRSNPWMEPFLPRIGLRWVFDKATGLYNPVDTWASGEPKAIHSSDASENREGYCSIALLPNLSGNGSVLLVSATGGSAFNAAAAFLGDETAMQQMRKSLPAKKGNVFPYFEALVRVKGRSSLPRDDSVVICRVARD